MHPLLDKLLKKRKIADVSHLGEVEKENFDQWSRILSEGEITVKTIEEFCQGQLNKIEAGFKDMDKSNEEKARLTILHGVYKSLINIISGPLVERETLEKYLNSLL